jgi:hypothetical protein
MTAIRLTEAEWQALGRVVSRLNEEDEQDVMVKVMDHLQAEEDAAG